MTNELVPIAEHEREAECPEQKTTQRCVDDALNENVANLSRSSETGFEHHEACLHEEHEECRDEHPHRVRGVHHINDLRTFICC